MNDPTRLANVVRARTPLPPGRSASLGQTSGLRCQNSDPLIQDSLRGETVPNVVKLLNYVLGAKRSALGSEHCDHGDIGECHSACCSTTKTADTHTACRVRSYHTHLTLKGHRTAPGPIRPPLSTPLARSRGRSSGRRRWRTPWRCPRTGSAYSAQRPRPRARR